MYWRNPTVNSCLVHNDRQIKDFFKILILDIFKTGKFLVPSLILLVAMIGCIGLSPFQSLEKSALFAMD